MVVSLQCVCAVVYACSLNDAMTLAPVLCVTWRALDTPLVGGADDSWRWRVSGNTESSSVSVKNFRIRNDTFWLSYK